jgi:hypothetical protein
MSRDGAPDKAARRRKDGVSLLSAGRRSEAILQPFCDAVLLIGTGISRSTAFCGCAMLHETAAGGAPPAVPAGTVTVAAAVAAARTIAAAGTVWVRTSRVSMVRRLPDAYSGLQTVLWEATSMLAIVVG